MHAAYAGYPTLEIAEILRFLWAHRTEYSVVYISGDTDSFASTRQDAAIYLPEMLADLQVDILFTTRADITEESIGRLSRVASNLRASGRLLIGCVCISQLGIFALELRPIPSPISRVGLLARLRQAGLVSVLAIRPILPQVPLKDYIIILVMARNFVDVVVGGDFYYLDETDVISESWSE